MKVFLTNILETVIGFSKKIDDLTLLTNHHWVLFDEIENSKTVYIFRPNNQLLISINGKVKKEKWEYLGKNSILIDIEDESYLFKNGFIDDDILALKQDSLNKFAIFVNESRNDLELNSLDKIKKYLNNKYSNKQKINLISNPYECNTSSNKKEFNTNSLNVSNKNENETNDESLSELELMKKYEITYKDEKYIFQTYRYDYLKDALNYAKLIKQKRKN
jgi:hypothetical protein